MRNSAAPASDPRHAVSTDSSKSFVDRRLESQRRDSDELLLASRMEHERLGRIYTILSRINETIIRASSKENLYARLNEILSKSGLFSIAGFAIVQPTTGELARTVYSCNLPCDHGEIEALLDRVFARHCDGAAQIERVVNDLDHAAGLAWRADALASGLRSFAAFPIATDEQFFGTVAVFSATENFFAADVVGLLRQLAEDMAYVIQTLDDAIERRTYEHGLAESRRELGELLHHLHSVREDERSLMARELHDELGQTLNTLKLDLRTLDGDQSPATPAHAARMTRMKLSIDSALHELHRVVSALYPRVLDDLGLEPAIEWLVGDFIDQYGIACRLKITLPPHNLPRATVTTAFRCIQECLTNIGRHALATSVTITMTLDRNTLKLVIADNAHGIIHAGPTANSFGQIGMRQRVELLGGSLSIKKRNGRGTRIEIALPVPPPEAPATVTPLKGTP